MQSAVPLACFLSFIRPPGVQYENALLQIAPVDKFKCPFIKNTNDIGFQLFTRHNPTVYQELVMDDDEKLFASNIDFHDRTVLYFHAFMEQPDDGSGIMVREAYMQRGDTNVIMVDAHHLEAGPWYFTAAQNTWYIGRFAAQFVDYLVTRGLNLNNTHLVGHSLGAQAAGVAGSALKSGRVARITGLDPALPLFDNLPLEQRLDTSDADFVDVIHTDAGIFGFNVPVGHVDYYPNGGKSPQPGCELEVVIPQQLLLNKCDSRTHTPGFYTFYLTNRQRNLKYGSLENNLQKLFAYIQSVRTSTKPVKSNKYSTIKNYRDNGKDEPTPKTSDNVVISTKNVISKAYGYGAVQNFVSTKDEAQNILRVSSKGIKEPNSIAIKETPTFDQTKQPIQHASKSLAGVNEEKDHYRLKTLETVSLIKDNEELLNNLKRDLGKSSKTHPIKEQRDTKRKGHLYVRKYEKDYAKTKTVYTTPKQAIKLENRPVVLSRNVRDLIKSKKGHTHILRDGKALHSFRNLNPETKDDHHLAPTSQDNKTFKDQQSKKRDRLTHFNNKQKEGGIKKADPTSSPMKPRRKRFAQFLNRGNDDNSLFKILDFLNKYRRNILPVFTVMREINTLVRSGNGELNHYSKERNNYIGAPPPIFPPITYSLELGNESKAVAFLKRLLGMSPKGDRLSVTNG